MPAEHSAPQAISNKAARVAAIVKADSPVDAPVEITIDAPVPSTTSTSIGPTDPEAPAAEITHGEIPAMAGTAPSTSEAAPDPEASLRDARRAILEEKLAAQRERRQADQTAKRVLAERAAAEADRQAAAAERAKWESAKTDFKTGLENLGMNPREVYEAMTKQALEAGTPEAQMKQLQAQWKAELESTVTPLKEEVEQLRAERVRLSKQAHQAAIISAFKSEITDANYQALRIEYDDADIFSHVQKFADDPESFYPIAEKYNVPLREPGGRFSMREVLQVLKAAQDAHERGREPRRARLAPSTQSPVDTQSTQPAPTVSGTAARSNAAPTITNDLASSRASGGPTRLSRKERVKALIERDGRR